MGYELYITRADDWCDSQKFSIEEQEWFDLVNNDPELEFADGEECYFVFWRKHPEVDDAWLWFTSRGYIHTKNPDEPLTRKMLEIASKLNAKVQGDDGEIYEIKDNGKIYALRYGKSEIVEFISLGYQLSEEERKAQEEFYRKCREEYIKRQSVWWRRIWRWVTKI